MLYTATLFHAQPHYTGPHTRRFEPMILYSIRHQNDVVLVCYFGALHSCTSSRTAALHGPNVLHVILNLWFSTLFDTKTKRRRFGALYRRFTLVHNSTHSESDLGGGNNWYSSTFLVLGVWKKLRERGRERETDDYWPLDGDGELDPTGRVRILKMGHVVGSFYWFENEDWVLLGNLNYRMWWSAKKGFDCWGVAPQPWDPCGPLLVQCYYLMSCHLRRKKERTNKVLGSLF